MRNVFCISHACVMALSILSFSLHPSSAEAVPITFEYVAVVDKVKDISGNLGGSITVGTTFVLRYTFESTTPGTIQLHAFTGYAGAVVDRSISFSGGPTFVIDADSFLRDIGIFNDHLIFGDTYFTNVGLVPFGNLTFIHAIDVFLDFSKSAHTSMAFPLTPPNPDNYDFTRMFIHGISPVHPFDLFISGQIVAIVPTVFPEPSAIVLFAVGLAIVNFVIRRSTKY